MTRQNEHRRPRRLTPPIAALSAFEAVVRCGSFTAAAEELALTQSAVSRQVSGLEALLGVALIEKSRRRQIALTASGAFYAEHVRHMLAGLAAATAETIALGGGGRVLRLGVPPAFGSLWLMPRLASFIAAHPDIAVEFSTRLPARPHSGLEDLHAFIDFAPAPGIEGQWDRLLDLELRPVSTPEIAEAIRGDGKADLAGIHLLVHPSERASWPALFEHEALAMLRGRPMLTFENYTMLLQAAVSGLGIALAPGELVETELAAGRLQPIVDVAIRGTSAGFLVYPPENRSYPPLEAFRGWLLETIAADRAPAA